VLAAQNQSKDATHFLLPRGPSCRKSEKLKDDRLNPGLLSIFSAIAIDRSHDSFTLYAK
jgi:hypothetical protein